MARQPEWYDRLESILAFLSTATELEWLGRNEIRAIFQCSDRDSIRLLHKFGAEVRQDSLSIPRSAIVPQLDAIRKGSSYAAFLNKRGKVARSLTAAQAENQARQFRIPAPTLSKPLSVDFQNLPATIIWRREACTGPATFQILYRDGADLMSQLAQFLTAAGSNRHEFLAATEPEDGPLE